MRAGEDIGPMLKDFRKKAGYTQTELAEYTGLKQSTISAIENGVNIPNFETIGIISEVLDLRIMFYRKSDPILEDVEDGKDTKQKQLITYFNSLNETGKKRALETLETFARLPEYKKKDIGQSAI